MDTERNTRSKIESPCIRNCCLDNNDICMGCFRSLNEIMQWAIVDENTRKEFMGNVFERKLQHKIDYKFPI